MKNKISTILLMAFVALATLQAQTERGRFIFGGGTSVDVTKNKGGLSTASETSSTTILIKPEVGYFLFNDFSIGLSAILNGNTGNNSDAGNADFLSEFKYFFKGTNFRPFVKANVGYRMENINVRYAGKMSTNSLNGLVFGGGVGGAFFVKENISIDLSLQYLHSNLKNAASPTYNYETDQMNKPLNAKMNDIKVLVGFSVYL